MDYGHGGVCNLNISILNLLPPNHSFQRTIEPNSVDIVYANHPHTTTNAHPG